MEKVQLLISRYFDDDLSDDEILELAAALRADLATVDRLVFSSFIHTQLQNWMDSPDEQFGDSSIGMPDQIRALSDEDARPSPRTASQSIAKKRSRFWAISGIAAALFVASTIAILAYLVTNRPTIVGQVTDVTNSRWAPGSTDIGVGTLLVKGRPLHLLEGSAIITFASGAKLHLEGPTTLTLNSRNGIELTDGHIAAKVPRQAVGFSVASSLARVVDYGTEFSLDLKADESFKLHVFTGSVELQLDKKFGEAARNGVYVTADHAMAFNTSLSDISTIPFEPGKQMPF